MNKIPEDLHALGAVYNERLGRFGNHHKTVGWGSAEDQALRFEVLCRGLSLEGRRILDVGCGLGDFVPWARQKFGDSFSYHGIDVAADLVERARELHGDEGRTFSAGLLEDRVGEGEYFDFVICSGTFSLRMNDNWGSMRKVFRFAWERTEGVLAANFLSTHVDYQLDKDFHFDPREVFSFARDMTPYVTLYHDYPLYEFSVQLHRQPTAQRASRGARTDGSR